jgi:hypothetical protein
MPMTAIGITELFSVPSELLVCPEAFKCACVVRVILCKDVGAKNILKLGSNGFWFSSCVW